MKSHAEHMTSFDTSQVWADEAPGNTAVVKLPAFKLLSGILVIATAMAIAGIVEVYFSGRKDVRNLIMQSTTTTAASRRELSQVIDQADHWAIKLALTAILIGGGLFALAASGGYWFQRRWLKRHMEVVDESGVRIHRLMSKLADSRVTEEEARAATQDFEKRLANVSQRHSSLERELEQRRETEKSLAQQAQELERSKDVLELHVQTRTQELQKLQRRNELILNSAAEGICGFDLQGRSTFVNPAAAKAIGCRIEELIGKTEEAIFFPPKPRGVKDGPCLVKDVKGEYLPEQDFYRKDGSSFAAEYVRTPIKENGKVIGAVVTFKDISERKLAEDKLNHKAAELGRSNRELEQFAFVASHDLQEPLRKIQAFGDRLKIKCEAVQLDEGMDYLERMQNAAARMQTLINDLLTFSRVISSLQPLVPVDLTAVTQEVLVDLEHRIEKTGALVTVGKLPTLQADPTQMRQLLQNLIGNALKFQPANSVPKIKIDAQLINRDQLNDGAVLPNPSPTAKADDPFCVLTVEDNGIGFDEQYLDKVFAVFQRLHGRSEYEGTGVGLAVCRRITDRHGGLITAQSKPGEGSTFIAILPMTQPEPQEHP